jgi:poly(3-hydroxybutyrate) depolymerase
VVALHSAAHDAAYMESITGLIPYADEHGFDVAFGQGIGGTWNAGGCCGDPSIDDLGYLEDLVQSVAGLTPVDRSRVYLIGFSNGGMMAYRAICQLPGTFAAAGIVAGALLQGFDCTNTDVHAYLIHGVADRTVPVDGGRGFHGYHFPPQASDPSRVGSNSVIEMHNWSGAHQYPPWATELLWAWLSKWRLD